MQLFKAPWGFKGAVSPSFDLAMAVGLVSALKDLFQEYRSETFIDNLWKGILDAATKCVYIYIYVQSDHHEERLLVPIP